MNDKVKQEVDDILEKTRVVPVTMIIALVAALTILTVFAVSVYFDSAEGSLHDAEGVVDQEGIELLNSSSPAD